jgi:hypothetical protein
MREELKFLYTIHPKQLAKIKQILHNLSNLPKVLHKTSVLQQIELKKSSCRN